MLLKQYEIVGVTARIVFLFVHDSVDRLLSEAAMLRPLVSLLRQPYTAAADILDWRSWLDIGVGSQLIHLGCSGQSGNVPECVGVSCSAAIYP